MELHIIKDYKSTFPRLKGKELTNQLTARLLGDLGMDASRIARTDRGKPYDVLGKIHFSISHTGDFFGVAAGDGPLGLDLQMPGRNRAGSIAQRFFTPEENSFLSHFHDDALEREFLRLWTRKEALSKYRGISLTDVLKSCNVIEPSDVRFLDLELAEGIVGSICIMAEENDEGLDIHTYNNDFSDQCQGE